jgi:hypothetical protein
VFGHKWEPAEGTVVESRYDHQHGARSPNEERVYMVDVRRPDGTTMRAEIRALSFMRAELVPGTVVRLEVHSKTGEIRFDQHHPVVHSPSSHAGQQAAAPGGIAAALAGLSQAAAQGQLGPGVHIVSQTSEVHAGGGPEVTMAGGEDTAELMRALLAGGSERAAAVERIKQLKADMIARSDHQPGTPGHWEPTGQPGRSGAPEGFNSGGGPSTFDQVSSPPPVATARPGIPEVSGPGVTPGALGAFGAGGAGGAGGVSEVGGVGELGGVGGAEGFGSASGTFADPADVFGSAGETFGPAGGGFGQGDKTERIARLQQQRDQGQLTEQQFAEQRQRILDEF